MRHHGSALPSSGPAMQILKAVCVAGMVAVHGFYWAATTDGRIAVGEGNALYSIVKSGMAIGILPLLLPFTAGCAMRMHWPGQDGSARPMPLRQALTQAALLAALGYLMNLLAAGPRALWAWNVLQFAGLSMVVTAVLVRIGGAPALALAGVAALAVADPLRHWIPFYQGPAWVRILLGDPADFHTWPFVLWFPTVAFGWLVADGSIRSRDSVWFRTILLLVGGAAACYAYGAGLLIPRFDNLNLIGPRVMQPPIAGVVGIIAWAALLTALVSFLAPYFRLAPDGFIRCFSAGILWIYVGHMVLGARLAALLPERSAVLADPGSPAALALLLGFPLFLLLWSWLVGYGSIRYLHEKAFRIRVRRLPCAPGLVPAADGKC